MAITTLSSRQFDQDTGRAKKASRRGPVFITDRGKPSFVLLSFEDYEELAGQQKSLAEVLFMPGVGKFDFEFPRLGGELVQPADFA